MRVLYHLSVLQFRSGFAQYCIELPGENSTFYQQLKLEEEVLRYFWSEKIFGKHEEILLTEYTLYV